MSAYCNCIQNRQLVNFEAGVNAQDPNIQTTKEAGPSAFSGSNSVGSVGGSHGHGGAGGEGDECKYQMWRGGKLGASRCHGYIERCRSRYYVGYNQPASHPPFHPHPTIHRPLSLFTLHSGDCNIYCDLRGGRGIKLPYVTGYKDLFHYSLRS